MDQELVFSQSTLPSPVLAVLSLESPLPYPPPALSHLKTLPFVYSLPFLCPLSPTKLEKREQGNTFMTPNLKHMESVCL